MTTPIILAISALFLGGLMKFFWQMGMENGVDIPSFFVVDALFLAKSHQVIDSSAFIKDQKPQFVPGLFEATFVHKSLRNGCQRLNQEAFPHKYDMPNCQNVPDVFLRNYPYTSI